RRDEAIKQQRRIQTNSGIDGYGEKRCDGPQEEKDPEKNRDQSRRRFDHFSQGLPCHLFIVVGQRTGDLDRLSREYDDDQRNYDEHRQIFIPGVRIDEHRDRETDDRNKDIEEERAEPRSKILDRESIRSHYRLPRHSALRLSVGASPAALG